MGVLDAIAISLPQLLYTYVRWSSHTRRKGENRNPKHETLNPRPSYCWECGRCWPRSSNKGLSQNDEGVSLQNKKGPSVQRNKVVAMRNDECLSMQYNESVFMQNHKGLSM